VKCRADVKKLFKHFKKEEDGVVIIVVALSMVILFTLAAYAVDLGIYDYQKARLQTACDAAALAAMEDLPGNTEAAEATALEYIQKNGFSSSDVVVSFPTDPDYPDYYNKITVASAQQQKTYFANILGIKHLNYNCRATAYYDAKPAGGAFDYLLFSGSKTVPLNMKTNYYIMGSIHTNNNFSDGKNKNYYVMGAIEACGTISTKGGSGCYGKLVPGASYIDILSPSFDSVVEQLEPKYPWGYNVIWTAAEVNNWISAHGTFTVPTGKNYIIIGSVNFASGLINRGKLVVYGDITVSGKIPSSYGYGNTGIYMDGNGLLFAKRRFDNSGGSIICDYHMTTSGCFFAESNITFVNGYVHVLSNKTLSIYAKYGNVDLNFGGTDGYGIIYAPRGQVTIGQGNTTWHGSIIGNTISTIPANVTVAMNDRMLPYIIGAKHAVLIE